MYIWMILAIFVTTLFSFNLHVRSDAKSLYTESQATTTIAKVTIWHNNLRDIVGEYHRRETGDTDPFRIGVQYSACDDDEARNLTYQHMRVKLNDPLPGTKSKLYCINEGVDTDEFFRHIDPDILCWNTYGGDNKLSCCSGEGVDGAKPGLYLITLAPIPVKWQQRDKDGKATGVPNNEMMQGLHKLSGGTERLGYLNVGDEYVIKSFGKDAFKLPKAITANDDEFFSGCKETSCIIYMSRANIVSDN